MTPEILLKAMVDETRRRCLMLLVCEKELCVCEFMYALEEIQPKISHHLSVLRKSGLVQDRKLGQWVHYRLHHDLPAWAITILSSTLQGITGTLPYRNDLQRLQEMPDRPGRCIGVTL